MKCSQLLLLVGLILALAATAQAKAAFKDKVGMIVTAQAIAVVEITGVEKVSVKGQHWTYGQKALAEVKTVIKGQLPSRVSLSGDENFICARCHFEVGHYLVFLDRDGELLTGNNWHLSARKISETQVKWFADDEIFKEQEKPLAAVLKEIQGILSKPIPNA